MRFDITTVEEAELRLASAHCGPSNLNGGARGNGTDQNYISRKQSTQELVRYAESDLRSAQCSAKTRASNEAEANVIAADLAIQIKKWTDKQADEQAEAYVSCPTGG